MATAPSRGDRVRVVGFGAPRFGVNDEVPTKRAGVQRVDEVAERTFRGRPDPATPCNHDSGGAVLDERGDLVGVISAGDLLCAEYALATRADTHRDFFEDVLEPAPRGGCSVASLGSSDARGGSREHASWLLLGTSTLAIRIIARKRLS